MPYRFVLHKKIDEVHERGIALFKAMMRLEFAMKDIGYGRPTNQQSIEVDWDRYAAEKLGKDFYEEMKKLPSARTILEKPPQKQSLDQGGNLQWSAASPVSSTQELIGAVRRVRNNLFHGGKSGDPDSGRNIELYAAALFVIDQILEKDAVLRTAFTGEY